MAHQLYYKAVLLQLLVVLLRAQKSRQILEQWVLRYSGRVLLIGQVPNGSVKETATSLAKGVEGVNDVYNELRIGPKITFGQITKDSWITTQIKSKLFVGDNVKATDVKVITENGEVFLLGNVTQSQGDSAAEIASKVTGVQKVVKVFKYLN